MKYYLSSKPILKTLKINGLLLKDSDFVYNKNDNSIEKKKKARTNKGQINESLFILWRSTYQRI